MTLIDAFKSFCILDGHTKFLAKVLVRCIWWQIESIKTETRQLKTTIRQLQPSWLINMVVYFINI